MSVVHLSLLSLPVSSGAFCSLTVVVSFPRCHQPLRPQDHLSGVASHPSHHSGRGVQRWWLISVGLRGAHEENLYSRGEFLCDGLVCFTRYLNDQQHEMFNKWNVAFKLCNNLRPRTITYWGCNYLKKKIRFTWFFLTTLLLVLCLDGGWRLSYRHEV